MADLLSIFRSDLGKVRVRRKNVHDELELARRRREELMTLPLPPDELCDLYIEMLDRQAAEYEERLAARVKSLSHDFIAHGSESPGAQRSMVLTQSQLGLSGQEIQGLLASLARDQVRKVLLKTIKGLDLKCGPSRAARKAELQDLEARINTLEAEAAGIQAQMAALQAEIES